MRSFVFASVLTIVSSFSLFSQEVNTVQEKEKEPRFMVTADFNYAYRFDSPDNTFNVDDKTYLNELQSGISYDISAYYMYTEYTGIGLKYNRFTTSASAQDAFITAPNGDTGFGYASDDVTMSYIGLSLIEDLLKKNSEHQLYLEASLGYEHYRDEVEALGSYTVSRGCFASSLGLSYQYVAFKNFSFGPKINLIGGTIGKVKVEGPDGYNEMIKFDGDKKEMLIRLDMGLTAAYRF